MFHLTVCTKLSFIYFPLLVPKMSDLYSFLHSSNSLQYFASETALINIFFAAFDKDILKVYHRIEVYTTCVGPCTPHVLRHLKTMVPNLVPLLVTEIVPTSSSKSDTRLQFCDVLVFVRSELFKL